MSAIEPTDLLTRMEAAVMLRTSIATLERKIKSGELKALKLGNGSNSSVRIRRSEVERFLAESETSGSKSAA
jgi:excisionase family DNA binding protein